MRVLRVRVNGKEVPFTEPFAGEVYIELPELSEGGMLIDIEADTPLERIYPRIFLSLK